MCPKMVEMVGRHRSGSLRLSDWLKINTVKSGAEHDIAMIIQKAEEREKGMAKIKDLPDDVTLGGVKFHDPKTGTTGYWFSQWGYENGKAGIFYKKDMKSTQFFPLCLDNLEEALEFDVVEEMANE